MITYNVIMQEEKKWGVDIAVDFYDDETDTVITKTFRSDNALIEPKLSEIMNHAIYNIKFDLNPLNKIDLGENFKEILIALIKYIRNNPNCTKVQLRNVAKNAYPNMFWKEDKLIDWIHNQMQNHFKTEIPFTEFKTYVINHSFEGMD